MAMSTLMTERRLSPFVIQTFSAAVLMGAGRGAGIGFVKDSGEEERVGRAATGGGGLEVGAAKAAGSSMVEGWRGQAYC